MMCTHPIHEAHAGERGLFGVASASASAGDATVFAFQHCRPADRWAQKRNKVTLFCIRYRLTIHRRAAY